MAQMLQEDFPSIKKNSFLLADKLCSVKFNVLLFISTFYAPEVDETCLTNLFMGTSILPFKLFAS